MLLQLLHKRIGLQIIPLSFKALGHLTLQFLEFPNLLFNLLLHSTELFHLELGKMTSKDMDRRLARPQSERWWFGERVGMEAAAVKEAKEVTEENHMQKLKKV